MLLTAADLKALTDYSRPSDQVKWLKDHGWPFEIGSKGFPKVLQSVAVARLGGKAENVGPSLRLDHEAA